jgi:hypothetical protein
MIEKGKAWERPASGPADWHVTGDDAALAAAVRGHAHARVEFSPSPESDLARAVGVQRTSADPVELAIDAMRIDADHRDLFGVNIVVFGVAPDRANWFTRDAGVLVTVDGRVVHDARATAVVVANGQFLRGLDLVPRGHPGDGRLEVQVYAPTRRERAAVRARLPQGVHLPHPRITQVVGRRIDIRADRGVLAVEIDGQAQSPAARVTVEVAPEAFSILV